MKFVLATLAVLAIFAGTGAGLVYLWGGEITAPNVMAAQIFTGLPTLFCLGGVLTVVEEIRA